MLWVGNWLAVENGLASRSDANPVRCFGHNKSSFPMPHHRPADSFRHFVASKRAKYQRCHSCQSQSDCEQTSKGWSGNLLATFFQHGGGDGGFARLLADGLPKLQSDGLCSFARSALLRNGESTAKARRMPFFNKMMKIERLIEKRMKMI